MTNVSGRIISQCKASEIRQFEVFRQVKENKIGSQIAKREHVVLLRLKGRMGARS